MSFIFKKAKESDAISIAMLYLEIYDGRYTNPLMRDRHLLLDFIARPENHWIVIENTDGQIIGSVVYEVEPSHRLAKAFGGAVLPAYRGHNLLQRAMHYAESLLFESLNLIDVVYATTRTASPAPQIVTEHLGYKKLGVFPNVHRTESYETHCLTAKFSHNAFQIRMTDFPLHPKLKSLFEIVRAECEIPALVVATKDDLELDVYTNEIALELIDAPKFALHRHDSQKAQGLLNAHFFPFHETNLVISSPCQSVEIFCYVAHADKHCTIMGVKKPREIDFTVILEQCVRLLESFGVRYIELIVRADKVKTMERVLKARFIPSAYFPAFQLIGSARYDFVAFTRTFEILDFATVKLSGVNKLFLNEYIKNLQKTFLEPKSSS